MPCYDHRDSPAYIHGEYADKIAAMQAKLDITTRLACDYCQGLEGSGQTVPAFAKEWWTKHKKFDRGRKNA